jgi:cobalamin biosynthesis protein CobT
MATVASVQTIFQRSKLSRQGWQSRLLEGRLDSRHAWRNDARGVVDIFKDRRAPSTTKVNVWLLNDASGSMRGAKAEYSQDCTATLVEAFKRISTVRLHVWQHKAMTYEGVDMIRIYERGKVDKVTQMTDNVDGGNADGFALQWIGEQALKMARADEKTIIIVISDGLPSVEGKNATNHDLISFNNIVASDLRLKGASVLCVAIEGGDLQGHARSMYGPENVIPFQPGYERAWSDLARGLGDLFGKELR